MVPSDPLPEPSTGLITRKSGGTIDFLFRVRDRLLTFCLFTAQLGLRRGRGVPPHPRRGARSSRERSPLAPIHGALKVPDEQGKRREGAARRISLGSVIGSAASVGCPHDLSVGGDCHCLARPTGAPRRGRINGEARVVPKGCLSVTRTRCVTPAYSHANTYSARNDRC
jgi:hypothetical protein